MVKNDEAMSVTQFSDTDNDFQHFSDSVNEEKIELAKGIYLTICSNPYTQI